MLVRAKSCNFLMFSMHLFSFFVFNLFDGFFLHSGRSHFVCMCSVARESRQKYFDGDEEENNNENYKYKYKPQRAASSTWKKVVKCFGFFLFGGWQQPSSHSLYISCSVNQLHSMFLYMQR